MKFELPSLPYAYDALEPYIDARTMEIHHTRHHAGYVTNLNKLLDGRDELASRTLEDIISDIRLVPDDIRQGVRNHGGGHLNHSLFWQIMGRNKGGEPSGPLGDAIRSSFTDFASFRELFSKTALSRFGSGWAWLCLDSADRLVVLSTPNQDSPIMQGHVPILGLDVWEHAYYLKYQNRRSDYIDAWWNVVNWEKVGELFVHRHEMVSQTRAV